MNITIEKPPVYVLEYKDVALIRDLRLLGIYAYVKMLMNQGEYTVPVIIDKMKEHFMISDKEILDGFKIIIEDLLLITMVKKPD